MPDVLQLCNVQEKGLEINSSWIRQGKFLESYSALGVARFSLAQGRMLLEGVEGCWMCYNLNFCRCKG
jgi:hypothetical protein